MTYTDGYYKSKSSHLSNYKRSKRNKGSTFSTAFSVVCIIYVINFVYFFIENTKNNDTVQSYEMLGGFILSHKDISNEVEILLDNDVKSESQTPIALPNRDNGDDEDDEILEIDVKSHGYAHQVPIVLTHRDNDDEGDETFEIDVKTVAQNATNIEHASSFLTMYGQHRVQSSLDALPQWFKDYREWNQQVTSENDSQSNLKYLVLTCLPSENCGGLTDRLRALPFYLFAASRTSRVLCIHWVTPYPLEYFLEPPTGGIEWRCPATLQKLINYKYRSHQQKKIPALTWHACDEKVPNRECHEQGFEFIQNSDSKFIIMKIKNNSHGRINSMNYIAQRFSYKDVMPSLWNWVCPDMIGDMFRVLFEPVKPLAQQINATMTRLGLVENQFVTAHLRSRYPTPVLKGQLTDASTFDKEGSSEFTPKIKKFINNLMQNALHCAHILQPDLPMLFLADDPRTVRAASSPFTFKKHTFHPIVIDREQDPKHFGASEKIYTKPEDFYPVFEDLLIMGGSKCVSHGIGSFGALGAALAGNTCRAQHQKPTNGRVDRCPNDRFNIKPVQIDPNDMLFGETVGGEGKIKYTSYHD